MLSQVQLVLRYICFFFHLIKIFIPPPTSSISENEVSIFVAGTSCEGSQATNQRYTLRASLPPRLLSASYIMQAVKVARRIQGQMLLR